MKKRTGKMPTLKAASGAGFSYEDKVAAYLFCEMLVGRASLGPDWGVTERIERQAGDWEPFGDLLLTVINRGGEAARCGCSVKSNRQVNSNGCSDDLAADLWKVMAKPVFNRTTDTLGLFCADLSNDVKQVLEQLCKQAREEERADRLDEKITHANHRKIYSSFQNPTDKKDTGLPRHVLARLIPRQFDFEAAVSRSQSEALALCREALRPEATTPEMAKDLWDALQTIASEIRVSGGSATRESLISKLRNKFDLRDDPLDVSAWAQIKQFSHEWMDQIQAALPGNLVLPRIREATVLCEKLAIGKTLHVLGESGSGKSALVKHQALGVEILGGEVVWIKASQFDDLRKTIPNFPEVLGRTRRKNALLVFDALEGCYLDTTLDSIGRTIALLSKKTTPWNIVLICQTPDWLRIVRVLSRTLPGHSSLVQRVDCGEISNEDLAIVCKHSTTVHRLAQQGRLQRLLRSVKILDILLNGQLAEDKSLAGEADLVEWWWDGQVRGVKQFAAEEGVARLLSKQMADDLVSEVSPDAVVGPADAIDALIKNRVFRRTQDGRIRFDHDLLADWSRVMYLRSLGEEAFSFMLTHAENPPWIRAIRLLSQHLLERATDLNQWQKILGLCDASKKEDGEPSAQNLQVLDAWLEGIAHCVESRKVLETLKPILFANQGRLLRRFIRRLRHVGTLPDPVMQQQLHKFDASYDDTVSLLFRLPMQSLWTPVVDFLVSHETEATDYMPVELAEVSVMWARLEEYLKLPWAALAKLVILNAEKELRREVAGEHRYDRGSARSDANSSRAAIYKAALLAALQFPDRVALLVLKAAGRKPWEKGDVKEVVKGNWRDEGWLGQWHRRDPLGHWDTYIKDPPESWPDGPTRSISRDFLHAWFETGTAIALFKKRPDAASEATLAFLISWPKAELIQHGGSRGYEVEHFGFTFEADDLNPPFWTRWNFLQFLRENWQAGLQLIIRLTNFATARYGDLNNLEEVKLATPEKQLVWRGNHQVYAWCRYEWNTAQVVTCALMSLEKWMDEQLESGNDVSNAISTIYEQSESLAFAGLLIVIGKRHPKLFVDQLKPLLFVRNLYLHDLRTVRECVGGGGYWPGEGKAFRKLRVEWNQLPGRNMVLKDACHGWLLEDPKLRAVLKEVSESWRVTANKLPLESDERLEILRWAADFDHTLWKETTLSDGQKGWICDRPAELQDEKTAENIRRIQYLIMMPYECSDLLERGGQLGEPQLENLWRQLQNWAPFEQLGDMRGEKEGASELRDHRHTRAGLVAVLLCVGASWLDKHPDRREWLESEVCKILNDPPQVSYFTANDTHDDYESLLARAAVRCWARSPNDVNWRGCVGSFVTAFRYRTLERLFQEAFLVRQTLGPAYEELESFALAFAVARRKATQFQFCRTSTKTDANELQKWGEEWLQKFAIGKGPKWAKAWSSIEASEPFSNERRPKVGRFAQRDKVHRRSYGFDMGVILAAFGQFPALTAASNPKERTHWLAVCKELLAAFCRTLPSADKSIDRKAEWDYAHWTPDDEIFKIIARRIFECSVSERKELWKPIIALPCAAHHHICSFLSQVLIEVLRIEPYRIPELIPIWHEMAEEVFATGHEKADWRDCLDVQKHILLYDSSHEEFWGPLIEDLRPFYQKHIPLISTHAHDHGLFVRFLATKAGERLLLDALGWLQPIWEAASDWFWESAVEDNDFSELLEFAWRHKFNEVRANSAALKAFKTLTLKLAAHHVPIAMEVQQHVGL